MGDDNEKSKPVTRPKTTFQKEHTTLHDIRPDIRGIKESTQKPPTPPKTKK